MSLSAPYEFASQAPATYECLNCGKTYSAPHHLGTHQGKCKVTKRRLALLLEETKAHWEKRKKARLDKSQGGQPTSNGEGSVGVPFMGSAGTTHHPVIAIPQAPEAPRESRALPPPPQTPADLDTPLAQRKAQRSRRLPRRYRSDSPDNQRPVRGNVGTRPAAVPIPPGEAPAADVAVPVANVQPLVVYVTPPDGFGISKRYSSVSGHSSTRKIDVGGPPPPGLPPQSKAPSFGPFSSRSAFSIAEWYWTSTQKSFRDFQKLTSILKSPTFSLRDIDGVNWKTAFKNLGSSSGDVDSGTTSWIGEDGWRSIAVRIPVPLHQRTRNPGVEEYEVGEFRYRPLLSIIKQKLTNANFATFHYHPYEVTWSPTPQDSIAVYGELYTSRAFRLAHDEIQAQPPSDESRGLERVVVALMFWSDATHLTSFGHASVWPGYLFFGNESKYDRCKPSASLGEQFAYFLKLPNVFKDYLTERNNGALPSKDLVKYCAKVLFHQQWSILLDEELLNAMKDGLIVKCPDGQRRCFFPRILTYSADYPERILIAGLRNNGCRPCHRCLIEDSQLGNLGSPRDVERQNKTRCETNQAQLVRKADCLIHQGWAVTGTKVEEIMKGESLTPVPNAFSKALSPLGFKLIPCLVADILHEFEIGVWKNLFIHLIRILATREPAQRANLDHRYRATPGFGRDTIRRFSTNASEMSRRAARDYEDLLQCAIPAFESILPEPDNAHLMTLLYICAQWHALAKLRLHNELTVDLLHHSTVYLGAQMRLFDRTVCQKYSTKELPKEAEARVRRATRKGKSTNSSLQSASLGVFTIKFHLLGDYCEIIRSFGTTDSFSTELGESFHRKPKSWYQRTDRKDYEGQFTEIERRNAHLSRIRAGLDSGPTPKTPSAAGESNQGCDNRSRYSIGSSQNSPIHISLLRESADPAFTQGYFSDFVHKLKRHLLPRLLLLMGYNPDTSEKCSPAHAVLQNDRIYRHQTMRIAYTTYDLRQAEDIINTGAQCNAMLLNGSWNTGHEEPPYLYAKVLGIFHANVAFVGALPDGECGAAFHRIPFLWVRWYESSSHGQEFELDRLSLQPLHSQEAVDFLDPSYVLRGVHIIPRFSLGKQNTLTPPSDLVNEGQLWKEYFINRFADRDLFMRYQYGMSIGHRYMYGAGFPSRPPLPTIPLDFDHGLPTETQPPGAIGIIAPPSPSEASDPDPNRENGESPGLSASEGNDAIARVANGAGIFNAPASGNGGPEVGTFLGTGAEEVGGEEEYDSGPGESGDDENESDSGQSDREAQESDEDEGEDEWESDFGGDQA